VNSCSSLGKALRLINVLVVPGSNSTFTSALAFFRPKVSTTIIVMGVRIRLRDILYFAVSAGDWYLSFFAVSAGDWSIVCSLCRDSTDFLSFLCIFYIPDLVRKSLPKKISYLVQNI
jgi:hypothetical protein